MGLVNAPRRHRILAPRRMSELDEAELRRYVGEVVTMYDRSIITGPAAVSKIAELCREVADINLFVPMNRERGSVVMGFVTRVHARC